MYHGPSWLDEWSRRPTCDPDIAISEFDRRPCCTIGRRRYEILDDQVAVHGQMKRQAKDRKRREQLRTNLGIGLGLNSD